jgi:phosphoglycerate dehydrogenase-like enzyme
LTAGKTVKAHLLGNLEPEFLDELRRLIDPAIALTNGIDIPEPADYHILISGVPGREHLEASPNLHTLIIPWAGLPIKTRALLRDFPRIKVHNIHHNAAATAEHAIALMLAAQKGVVSIDRAFRQLDWRLRYERHRPPLLERKTVLILGFGAIGQRIARTCRGLGMDVQAIKRDVGEGRSDGVALHPLTELMALLPEVFVLFICLPLTEETERMISRDALAALPDGAVIVNIARGAIIDEAALYEELKSGRIAAGLDVWYDYPKDEASRGNTAPSRFPFHELDNVVMTPHLAGHCTETARLRARELADLLNKAAAGEELPNKVDVKRGY